MTVLRLDGAGMNTEIVERLSDVQGDIHKIVFTRRSHVHRGNQLGFRQLPDV